MDPQRWRKLQELFVEARSAPADEREPLLFARAGGDPELLGDVRSLLAADAEPGILDRAGLRFPSVAGMLKEPVPERIGAYRVVRELGRGGMGTVYLAERVDGQFQQRVAIKLIGTRDADDPLHRRFLAERQILAGLHHPNIARLLDGGITDDGLPYLVMEYVAGVPITTFCDRHRLGIEERLRLFMDVCAAVQHAHQNLIIHRDLKPSNILVAEPVPASAARARAYLLDFGIAKLLNPALSAVNAPVTRVEVRVMTPAYASPEQVRGDTLTTASDIYSLGTLLYELLTGSTPHPLTTGSPAEVLEVVCEHDPVRPSTRVTRSERPPAAGGETEEVTPERRSSARNTTIERLRRQLKGDLDSIVMMALRKEPGRRYASADLLRQDLERYLEGLPVLAHRGSRRYRAAKFIQRHRGEAAAAMFVAVSLLAGLGTAVWQGRIASLERDRAEQALAQSQEVTDFLMGLFRTGDSATELPAGEITALDLLQRGIGRAHELSDQPVVHARLLDVIGQMLLHLGRYDDAQTLLEQAVTIRRAVLGPRSVELAASLIHLSWVHRSRSDLERARPLVVEALEIRRQVLPPDHADLAEAHYELGWLAGGTEQERLYRSALEVLQKTGAAPAREVQLLQALSTNLRRRGRLAEAVASDREALRRAESAFGPEHAETGYAMIHLADHVRDLEQDLATAERLYRRGLELMTRRFGENSINLIHGLHSLGSLQSLRGHHAEAEQLFRRSLDIRRSATGADHPAVADEMHLLASELLHQGRLEEAESLAREALDRSQRALGARHAAVINARLPFLAELLDRRGRHAEADRTFRAALEDNPSSQVTIGQMRRSYGRMLLQRGDHVRAEEQLLESLAVLDKAYAGSDHPNLQETKRALMELYRRWGKPDLVERYRVPEGRFVPY